jgi:PKD repeat protein
MISLRWLIVAAALLLVLVMPVPAAVNGIGWSQELDDVNWTKSYTSVPEGLIDSIEAPDSTMTADSLNETTGTNGHYINQNPTLTSNYTSVADQNYTFSAYLLKTGTRSKMQLSFGTGPFGSTSVTNRPYANYDLSDCSILKVVNASFTTAESVGNGWCRVSITARSAENDLNLGPVIFFIANTWDAPRFFSYAGTATMNVWVWGLQVETGDTMSAYNATNLPVDPPVADFTYSRSSAGYGGDITFTDTSTETPEEWYWEFGDGNTSTSQNPTFVYNVPGTYAVNLWAENSAGGDWENKTSLITIDNWPDTYMDPYANMTPWLDQEDAGICSGTASANAMMILRYHELGTTPSETQEPVTRDVDYNVSGTIIHSDAHVNYTPSAGSIYHDIYDADSTIAINSIGENLKLGYNLQTDQITPKAGTTEYFYPQTEAYDDAHKYNPIESFERYRYNTTANWSNAMEETYRNQTVILHIDVYSNLHSAPANTLLPEPTGDAAAVGHYVATVGYNRKLNELYFLHSYGDNEGHQKIGGITQTYWQYGGTKSEFIVPYNITVNEELPEPPAAGNILILILNYLKQFFHLGALMI